MKNKVVVTGAGTGWGDQGSLWYAQDGEQDGPGGQPLHFEGAQPWLGPAGAAAVTVGLKGRVSHVGH